MAKQMEYGEIIAFFEERYRILDSSELSYQRKTFSFENPHRCRHCQDSFITVATQYPRTHCMYCSFAGIDQPANDGRDPICGQCHWPYENVEQRTFSATLGYDLAKAIAAAKEGCVLYERLVDDVVLKMRGGQDWRTSEFLRTTDYRFQLRANSYSSGGIHSCTLKATFTLETNLAALVARRGLSLDDLQGWTTAANPAARYLSSRPYELDVKSPNSLRFAQDCLRECLHSHDRCVPFLTDRADRESRILGRKREITIEVVDIDHIPSRFIYVGSKAEQSQVTLVEMEDAPEKVRREVSRLGYAVLSYCWGGDQSLKLTEANHRGLKVGIAISNLPQTLQDAVWVTRRMGMDYLWIDALCILQDSDKDMANEIARMASYYNCAKLCICAAAATRSTEGFL